MVCFIFYLHKISNLDYYLLSSSQWLFYILWCFIHRLLRVLQQTVVGFSQSEVLVVLDGPRDEALQLLQLFKVKVVVHEPQGNQGEHTRWEMGKRM